MDDIKDQKQEIIDKKLIFHNQQIEAYKKLFKQFHYDRAFNDPSFTDDYIPEVYKEEFQKYIVRRSSAGRYKYVMYTINFREDIDHYEVLKAFLKYTKKKWIKKSYSCFEWRDIDKGQHIHSRVEIIPDDPEKPNRITIYQRKREVYNTFKHLVGNKLHINARYSNRKDCFIAYVKGLRKGKPKECMTCTMHMRSKLDLLDIYEFPEI